MGKTHFRDTQKWAQDMAFYHDPGPGFTIGNAWFVNSVTGTDSAGNGYSPDAPLATIKYAVATAAVANNGDVVYVAPGHTETLTAAAGIAMSKAGVRVVGLGKGRLRPVINYTTAAAASFDITAANCSVENIVFTPIGVATVTAAVNVQAADISILNCEFELANSTNQAAIGILTTAAANRMLVQGCHFHGSNNGTTTPIQIVGGTDIRILDNIFEGAFVSGQGAINQITTTTVNCVVGRCVIQNYTAGCTKAMVFTASSTGQIFECRMQILSGTAPITGAAMSWVGANYYAATIATAGTLI